MAKQEIVKALAVEFGMEEPTSKRVVQFVLDQIVASMASEGRLVEIGIGHYDPVEKVKRLAEAKFQHAKTAGRLKSKLGDEGVAEAKRLQQQHTPDVIRYAFLTLPT